MTAKKRERTRLETIFALHAAATAAPSVTLEHVTADGTTEITSVAFWLAAVPSDRRPRPRFSYAHFAKSALFDAARESNLMITAASNKPRTAANAVTE